MKPIVVKSDFLVPKGYIGITIFPFVIIRKSTYDTYSRISEYKLTKLLKHETTHFYQQLGLLVIPFYIIYVLNYIINRFIYLDHSKAYRNIMFEREARDKESQDDPKYKLYGWIKYARDKNKSNLKVE